MTDNKELIAELRKVLEESPSAGHAEVIQFEGSFVVVLNPDLYDELVTRAGQAADALEAAERDAWQDIATAPKDGSRILLCSDGGAVWMGHWIGMSGVHAINGWTRYNCVDIGWEPNHWRPLPAPPKKED